jgi:hypothetical protein
MSNTLQRFCLALTLVLIFSVGVWAQAVGDYGSNLSGGTGSWSAVGTWMVCTSAGTWAGATSPALSVPTSTTTVNFFILGTDQVNVDANAAAHNINVASTATLTATNSTVYIGLYGGSGSPVTLQFDGNVGTGGVGLYTKFQSSSTTYTIQGSGTTYLYRFAPSAATQTIKVSKNVALTYTGGSAIYANAKGPFIVTIDPGCTLTTTSTGNITVGSTSDGTDPAAGATMTLNVNGTLALGSGANLNLANLATFTTTLNIGSSGILNLGGSLYAKSTSAATAINVVASSGSIVNFSGASSSTLDLSKVPSPTLSNLAINNAAGVTLSQATTISGILAISTGATLNLGGFTNSANQLSLGGVGQTTTGIWGSTTSGAAHINDTYFAATTGTVSVTAPLPVELVSFTATGTHTGAVLAWKTATEKNNYGFNVERRVIGNSVWSKVGFVAGHGTSNVANSYNYADANVAAGTYAYRVAQVDNDGTVKTYNESQVTVGAAAKMLTLGNYPNPFNPTTTFEFSVPNDGLTTVKIYNVLGQELVTAFSGEVKAGTYQHATFDGSKFSSGVYFYAIENNGQHMIKKMLMMK